MIDDRERIDLDRSNPNTGERKQVPFRKYMQAPQPLLIENFKQVYGNTNNNQGRTITNRWQRTAPEKTYVVEKVYTGKINGKRSASRAFAYIDLNGGGRASVKDVEKKQKVNDIVDVEYRGVNSKGFDEWGLNAVHPHD